MIHTVINPNAYRRFVHRMFLVVLCAVLALVAYFFNISLVAFQKVAMIAPVSDIRSVAATDVDWQNHRVPDVRNLLSAIPYQNGGMVFDILPRDRFHKTVEMGYGNCSNYAFGMAYLLLQSSYSFQIVHFIPYQGFLTGNGHTLLNMRYRLDGSERTGLVDMMEGGLPVVDGHYLNLPTLQQKHLPPVTILPLSPRKDTRSEYYGEFLNNAAIGIVKPTEIERYFTFVERTYLPLGNKRLERIIYSGLAMLFGQFPSTYVSAQEYEALYADKAYLPWLAQLLLWLTRLMLGLMGLAIAMYFRDVFNARMQLRQLPPSPNSAGEALIRSPYRIRQR